MAQFSIRAHHRHVARVIDDALFLLVGVLVLFIDDDEAESRKGQEQRRTRAHHDARLPAHHGAIGAFAFAQRQIGMPFHRAAAEAGLEAVEKLHRQRDLGQQDQRLTAVDERFGHRFEIGFGLARTGDAVEQRDRKFPLPHRIAQMFGGAQLIGAELDRIEPMIGLRVALELGQVHESQRARIGKSPHHAWRDASLFGD